jgi:23S rRNA (uracil1939-C5)-methyltransferase
MRVTIRELAPGGEGVAIGEIDGERRAVFVRGVALGDDLRVAVDLSRRPARGRVLAILGAGPGRVAPACPHVERCGGCDWMHLSPEAQAEAHALLVRTALPDHWHDHPILAHPASRQLGYRTRARLHVRVSGGRAIVGMHGAGTNDPVPVDECIVLVPSIERVRRELGAVFEGAHGRGEVQIALGAARRDGSDQAAIPVLEVKWGGAVAAACFARLDRGVTEGRWAGARVLYGEVARPAIVGDPTPWMPGADGEPLRLAPGGFAQASEEGNATLAASLERALAAVQRSGADARPLRVVELYAGAGNLTVLLARRSPAVTGVEASREACDAARANLADRGLVGRIVEADAEAFEWPTNTDLLVLDPPRTGARKVAERLVAARVRHVVYVSCDPTTLGRDLAILAEAYEPRAIETFEMFPQTSHVETLVRLERKARAAQGARSS